MGDTGTEHPPLALPKTKISEQGGAKSDAHDVAGSAENQGLTEVIAVWSKVPDHIKAAIKALVAPYADT